VGETVPKEQLTKAQADLAAEKQKTAAAEKKAKDLEAELAAAQKPAKVYYWEPCTWIASGTPFDYLVYMADWLNLASNGRISMTPSAPGAICPVAEEMEAVSAGTTQAMLTTPSHYAGKFPLAALFNTSIGLPSATDVKNCYELFQDGKAFNMYKAECEKLYNVVIVAEHVAEADMIYSSNVRIDHVADLKGLKFRCGDEHIAGPLTILGASTVWFPGTEIYTSLATHVVDAFTYGSAYDHLSIGAHEVTKYWLKWPALVAALNDQFTVNRDIWNEMPEDLQMLVKEASDAADYRCATEAIYLIDDSWSKVIAAGITPIYWDANDAKIWVEKQYEWAKKYTDQYPVCAEFMKVVADYRVFKGYD
jgi:TRAP-type mannitol/chloroaromatic compound transport system substrate-binding protein